MQDADNVRSASEGLCALDMAGMCNWFAPAVQGLMQYSSGRGVSEHNTSMERRVS